MGFSCRFFRDFVKQHPDCVLEDNTEFWQMYDCVDDVTREDLDCWYYKEYEGIVVFADLSRYDFEYCYKVFPDRKTIYALGCKGKLIWKQKQGCMPPERWSYNGIIVENQNGCF